MFLWPLFCPSPAGTRYLWRDQSKVGLFLSRFEPWLQLGLVDKQTVGIRNWVLCFPDFDAVGFLYRNSDRKSWPPSQKNKQKTLVSNSNFFVSIQLKASRVDSLQNNSRVPVGTANGFSYLCQVTQKTYCTLVKKLNVTLAIACL